MYKKEILGNNSKEHLFSPPLSLALPRSVGGYFFIVWAYKRKFKVFFIWLFWTVSIKIGKGGGKDA